MSDLYARLGVSRDASLEDIRKAYKDAARVKHPDRGGDPEEFKKVQEAHEVLSDEERRRMYDMTGSTAEDHHGPPMGGAGGMPFGFPFAMGGMPFNMGDIFGQMFGGGGRPRRPGGRGPNKHHDISLRLSEFYKGHEIKLKFNQARKCKACSGSGAETTEPCGPCRGTGVRVNRHQIGPGMFAENRSPCADCNGEGTRIMRTCRECHGKRFIEKEKQLDIRITPGMREGEQLVFAGECSDTLDHDAPGDVVLSLRRADSPVGDLDEYEWKEDDLWIRRRITYAESVLGFKLAFDTHPSGTKPSIVWRGGPLLHGAVLQMPGMGMRKKNGEKGNMFVQIVIDPPPTTPWSVEDAGKLRAVLGGASASLEEESLPSFIVSSTSPKVVF